MVQDVKVEIIKETQMWATCELENLGKRSEITDERMTKRIQEMQERISGVEDTFEDIEHPHQSRGREWDRGYLGKGERLEK
jgi:ppGpp synthetase/RelA/SpoT-type nucleotidyltranferase